MKTFLVGFPEIVTVSELFHGAAGILPGKHIQVSWSHYELVSPCGAARSNLQLTVKLDTALPLLVPSPLSSSKGFSVVSQESSTRT